MARGDSEGVDAAAVTDTVERALAALDDVRRIRQQLTGAKTQIDKASEIVGAMSDRVRAHLDEIAALVRDAAERDEQAGAPAAVGATGTGPGRPRPHPAAADVALAGSRARPRRQRRRGRPPPPREGELTLGL